LDWADICCLRKLISPKRSSFYVAFRNFVSYNSDCNSMFFLFNCSSYLDFYWRFASRC